jgi:acetolactate synthase-1/2/3 large subunit
VVLPDKERIICLAGDGSLMMNLQELQTVAGNRLPIKVFILNNQGYHSIRQTQRNFFPDNVVGCGEDSGLSFPDFEKVAGAFTLPFRRIQKNEELEDAIRWALAIRGPALCEVMLDLAQGFAPKLSSRKLEDGRMETAPLDDMAPFLSREELAENIIT